METENKWEEKESKILSQQAAAFYHKLRQAANESRKIIRNIPALTESPMTLQDQKLSWKCRPEIILDSLCLKKNCAVLPAAINKGNIVIVDMLNPRLNFQQESGKAYFFTVI